MSHWPECPVEIGAAVRIAGKPMRVVQIDRDRRTVGLVTDAEYRANIIAVTVGSVPWSKVEKTA